MSVKKLVEERRYRGNHRIYSSQYVRTNGQVERSYEILWRRVGDILNNSGVEIVSKNGGKSPHELFHGKECKIVKSLRLFGEVGVKTS
jgi:hypothetical protein